MACSRTISLRIPSLTVIYSYAAKTQSDFRNSTSYIHLSWVETKPATGRWPQLAARSCLICFWTDNSKLGIAVCEARMFAPHYKPRHDLLITENEKLVERMEVEHHMAQNEIVHLHEWMTRIPLHLLLRSISGLSSSTNTQIGLK
jgi:hypothetical protein